MLEAARNGDKRADKILQKVSQERGIKKIAITPEILADARCGLTFYPKVKFETLAQAKKLFGAENIYACECMFWHATSTRLSSEPLAFRCLCCELTYALREPGQRYCCKGCRRRLVDFHDSFWKSVEALTA